MTDRTIAAVLEALDARAPFERAAVWDPVGLQIGDPTRAAGTVAVCHEATAAVCDQAVASRHGLLVSYHPLVFRPLSSVTAGSGVGSRVLQLVEGGVALAAVHTAWDVAQGGAADALAAAIGLREVVPWAPLWGSPTVRIVTYVPAGAVDAVAEAMAAVGAGRIGGYAACSFRSEGLGTFTAPRSAMPYAGRAGHANREPETRLEMVAPAAIVDRVVAALSSAHPYEVPSWDVLDRRGESGFLGRVGSLAPTTLGELASEVERILGSPVRTAGVRDRSVARVAVVPGSGGDMAETAAAAGADAVITGDVSHHQARRAVEAGVAVIDPGHAATERPGVTTLYAAVAEAAPGAVDLGWLDPDPWSPH